MSPVGRSGGTPGSLGQLLRPDAELERGGSSQQRCPVFSPPPFLLIFSLFSSRFS